MPFGSKPHPDDWIADYRHHARLRTTLKQIARALLLFALLPALIVAGVWFAIATLPHGAVLGL